MIPMHGNCWAKLETSPTNLDISSVISFRGKKWALTIRGNKALIQALDTPHMRYPITDHDAHNKHRKSLNGIMGHARNVIYLAFDIDVKWGYEFCDGEYMSSVFPSIHQQTSTEHSSTTFTESAPATELAYLETVARTRKKSINLLLNYYRRAQELDALGYDAESFLNFYKILECFYELGKGSDAHKSLYSRFTIKGVGRTRDKAKPSLGRYSSDQIYFATAVFAGIGYDSKLHRSNLLFLLRMIAIRNSWNVGHKIFRYNPYDTYDAIGQHSDEFRHVMIQKIYLETLCKYFILRYVNPAKFKLDNSSNQLTVELK